MPDNVTKYTHSNNLEFDCTEMLSCRLSQESQNISTDNDEKSHHTPIAAFYMRLQVSQFLATFTASEATKQFQGKNTCSLSFYCRQ